MAAISKVRLAIDVLTQKGNAMSNFTDANPWRRTPEGSLNCTITIRLHKSGMARFIDPSGEKWIMRNDEQVIGNVIELLQEGRRKLHP